MRRLHWGLLLVLLGVLLLPASQPATAQQSTDLAPIIYLQDGDFYRFSPSTSRTERITTWGYNERPVLSPSGVFFAYNSWARQYITANNNNPQLPGNPPSNIWLWDTRLGDDIAATRIADQPASATYPTLQTQGNGAIIRSTPTFSLDSTELAWVEASLPNYTTRLMVYSTATRQQRVVATNLPLGFQDAGIFLPEPQWGAGGILYSWVDAPQGGNTFFTRTVRVYDPTSSAVRFEQTINAEETGQVLWLDDMPQTLAILTSTNFDTLNVRTGVRVAVNPNEALLSVYNLLNPAAATVQTRLSPTSQSGFGYNWTVNNNGSTVAFTASLLARGIAVSPQGGGLAYLASQTPTSFNFALNGGLRLVAGSAPDSTQAISALIWGPTGFAVNNAVGSADVLSCAGAPQPRLFNVSTASVIPGLGSNVLRGSPGQGAGSAELLRIPENGVVTVLEGPFCASGFYWWLVNYNGTLGYTAEGDREGGVYWLQPVS